jgi:nitrogen fixation NifU-like protein
MEFRLLAPWNRNGSTPKGAGPGVLDGESARRSLMDMTTRRDGPYERILLDHARSPRQRRSIESATHTAKGLNSLCGDRLEIFARVVEGRIVDASFIGDGCAISTAAASILTEKIRGLEIDQARGVVDAFRRLFSADASNPIEGTQGASASERESLGDLIAFEPVARHGARIRCATLAAATLTAALDGHSGPVTTEA